MKVHINRGTVYTHIHAHKSLSTAYIQLDECSIVGEPT